MGAFMPLTRREAGMFSSLASLKYWASVAARSNAKFEVRHICGAFPLCITKHPLTVFTPPHIYYQGGRSHRDGGTSSHDRRKSVAGSGL